ncbi:hypothetical protein [Mycobacterium nebraskense]|nr:hypothetical protein [Mycobacterium nebraskense]MBI2695517.1 hypothetical protein [Mycobacterium nebraskense]MCV7116591.1 hypothetical protein [Mycobacterium nebraskense]
MTTGAMVLIVGVAVAAILLIAGPVWLARTKRNKHGHVEADKIRGAARQETLHVRQQEALADETAAKAHAAKAEADVNAAQASGLQQQAAAHRNEAATSRGQLNGRDHDVAALESPQRVRRPASGAASHLA